jgi:cytochrome c-type biogenesis protein CcmE
MNLRIIIAVLVIAVALGAFIFLGGKGQSGRVMVLDVKQLVQTPGKFKEQELRVRGFVKPGSILRSGEQADFVLTMDEHQLRVRFDGSTQLPDTFADGVPARADGYLQNDGTLLASRLEAKCTSKYDGTAGSQMQGHPDNLKNPYAEMQP